MCRNTSWFQIHLVSPKTEGKHIEAIKTSYLCAVSKKEKNIRTPIKEEI
jgi:hypothetical protein